METYTNKTKIMIFRKWGTLRRNLNFEYNGEIIEIVKKFTYLGVVFTIGGSFSETHEALSGQALKHAYQSLACTTEINTKFSELFSPKRVYVTYKNAILSNIGCSFRT